jgi:hypothetical protein
VPSLIGHAPAPRGARPCGVGAIPHPSGLRGPHPNLARGCKFEAAMRLRLRLPCLGGQRKKPRKRMPPGLSECTKGKPSSIARLQYLKSEGCHPSATPSREMGAPTPPPPGPCPLRALSLAPSLGDGLGHLPRWPRVVGGQVCSDPSLANPLNHVQRWRMLFECAICFAVTALAMVGFVGLVHVLRIEPF